MCRGRRARILLHLHIQLEGTVLRGSRAGRRFGCRARGSQLCVNMCVFYYCRTYYKAVRVGGGGEWRTCSMRDDEPRPVWMSLLITH
jgi:hypothetical protein